MLVSVLASSSEIVLTFFSIAAWRDLLVDARLLMIPGAATADDGSPDPAPWGCALAPARACWWQCKMIVVDEFRARAKVMSLSVIEFFEAFVRLADGLERVPADDELDAAGCDRSAPGGDVVAFEHRCNSRNIWERRGSSPTGRAEDDPRPLAARLDRLLFWVVGTIAVRCGGALTTGGGKVSLLGRYISREQIRMLGKG